MTARLLVFELLERHYPQRSFQPADVLRAYPSYLCSGTGLKVACRLAHLRQCGLLPEVGDAAIPLTAVLHCWKEGATHFCQKFGLSEEGVASFEAGYEQSRDWQRLLQRSGEAAAGCRDSWLVQTRQPLTSSFQSYREHCLWLLLHSLASRSVPALLLNF